jgi:hypothetical protein
MKASPFRLDFASQVPLKNNLKAGTSAFGAEFAGDKPPQKRGCTAF